MQSTAETEFGYCLSVVVLTQKLLSNVKITTFSSLPSLVWKSSITGSLLAVFINTRAHKKDNVAQRCKAHRRLYLP